MENRTRGKEHEKASDIELALFLIKHIEKPCEDLEGNNIRSFYIREAQRILNTIKNPDAKKLLVDTMDKYM